MTRPISADLFDKIATPQPPRYSLAADSLWGTKAIANHLGRSPDSIRRMILSDPTFPVRKKAGVNYSSRIELLEWLRSSEP